MQRYSQAPLDGQNFKLAQKRTSAFMVDIAYRYTAMMNEALDVLLVDGSSYIYRAFHALPPLTNSKGEPTGVIHGVTNMLLRFVQECQAKHIGLVFDAPGKTFRDDLYAEYKAHRAPMPDDLRLQIEPTLAILRAHGLPVFRVEGVEADDVIGTLACRAVAQGKKVLISTGDKDMAQLVNDSVTLINTMSNTRLDREGVKAKFDVYPEQIIDYLALVGDSSDNIPGIDKVGAKTAAKLLNKYQTLDQLIKHAGEVPGKVGENLRAGFETLALSRKLATIDIAIDLPFDFAQLIPSTSDVPLLKELYERYELRSLLRQLEDSKPPEHKPQAPRPEKTAVYETVTEWSRFEYWLERITAADLFSFDTETTSLDYMQAEIVGVSLCITADHAAYIPLAHDYAGAPEQLSRAKVLDALKPILEDPQRGKIGQHIKYDAHVLLNHDIQLSGIRFDTMLESYVWNSVATRHDMDSMAEHYLGIKTITFADVAGKGAKQLSFNQVPLEQATHYAAEDADVTLKLHETLWQKVASVPALQHLYQEIEQPLIDVLIRMEHYGVLVDRERLRDQSRQIAEQLQQLEEQAHTEAGHVFNLDSPKQLQHILFEKLQLPVVRKTPTGQPSTAEDVLEELATDYALPRIILEYRTLAKLKSTYTDKLPGQINPRTGRIHTSYHQAIAQTGRLSSSDPNLQNIPIRRAEGRRVRQAFIAPPGHVVLAADYSQIELRIMAHLSNDPGLLQAFAEDRDVHQATAAEIFAVAPSAVTADQRRQAKTINFGLIYGMSTFGLAKRLEIDRYAAQSYIDRYFSRYPGVRDFMEATRTQARQQGYVETVYGRRLYLPEINSRNRQLQQGAERAAINAPMQGTAADIIKRAMIAVHAALTAQHLPARLIMQVHDELVFEVHQDHIDSVSQTVRGLMENAGELKVPLRVDMGSGINWDEAH
jgi:DNA polymerase I